MSALEEAVADYVDGRHWDTLIGRSWNMNSSTGRQEFIEFLSKHIEGVVRSMDDVYSPSLDRHPIY